MKQHSGRYVLLLNNDTLVNGPSLDAMVEFLDMKPDAGAVGGNIIKPRWFISICWDINFSSLHEEFLIATRLGVSIKSSLSELFHLMGGVKAVDWLSSACLLLRREALDQVGLLG